MPLLILIVRWCDGNNAGIELGLAKVGTFIVRTLAQRAIHQIVKGVNAVAVFLRRILKT